MNIQLWLAHDKESRANALLNASPSSANAQNDRQWDYHSRAQAHSLEAGTINLTNKNQKKNKNRQGQ